jgi:hypothetical protein
MAFDFTPWAPPRRTFEPDANHLDAKACRTTAARVADFKRRHGLARGDRLSEAARALLLQEIEADLVARKGEQLARAHALALIAERATPDVAAAVAEAIPFPAQIGGYGYWYLGCDSRINAYLLNRARALAGKRYTAPSAACKWAATVAPAATAAAAKIQSSGGKTGRRAVADRLRLRMFWGVILRLDQLEGPPPADPLAFYSWCQLEAYEGHHTGPSLGDLLAGRMQETEARALLQLPTSGPLEGAAIRSAYRAQARTAHPDAGGDRQRFERLSEARDRLLLEVA